MGLFLPVNLPVTYWTVFPRGTQVCAFSFLCRRRSSRTLPKILHFLLHYLHSCLPCPIYKEGAEVSLFLPYNPLLTLPFFFFFLCLHQRQCEICPFLLRELQYKEIPEGQYVHSVLTAGTSLPFFILFFPVLLYPFIPVF